MASGYSRRPSSPSVISTSPSASAPDAKEERAVVSAVAEEEKDAAVAGVVAEDEETNIMKLLKMPTNIYDVKLSNVHEGIMKKLEATKPLTDEEIEEFSTAVYLLRTWTIKNSS